MLQVESLAKKYEEKYKQSGDVASKLSIEEATFRDVQVFLPLKCHNLLSLFIQFSEVMLL